MNYTILFAEEPRDLEEKVEEYLEDGWELYGYPFADSNYVHQAMIIKKDKE